MRVTFDPLTHSAQWSRRFIGLKLFMALAEQGEAGYAAMIEHQARHGRGAARVAGGSGWRIVNDTPLPVVCFTREGLDPARVARRAARAADRLDVRGPLGGRPVMRACITSFRTTADDIQWIVGEMNQPVRERCAQKPQLSTCRTRLCNRATAIEADGIYETGNDRNSRRLRARCQRRRSVAVPIYQTVAYAFDSAEHAAALFNLEAEGFRYTRIQNPTTAVLERRVAALEGGFEAMCVGSGQAAVNYAVLNVAALGTNIVSSRNSTAPRIRCSRISCPSQGMTVRFAE